MRKRAEKPEKPTAGQHRAFIQTARELGCDESPESFARVVKRLVEAPPAPPKEHAPKESGETEPEG